MSLIICQFICIICLLYVLYVYYMYYMPIYMYYVPIYMYYVPIYMYYMSIICIICLLILYMYYLPVLCTCLYVLDNEELGSDDCIIISIYLDSESVPYNCGLPAYTPFSSFCGACLPASWPSAYYISAV